MRALPLVSKDIGAGMAQDMNDPDGWFVKYSAYLDDENPVIAEFLAKLTDKWEEENSICAMWAALAVYRMLEAQSQSNQMSETIKLG